MKKEPGILRQNHPVVNVLLLGYVFLIMVRAMSIPFLAVYLAKNTDLNAGVIGAVVGVIHLAGTFGGFIGGTLSDFIGRKKVLIGTLYLSALIFSLYYFSGGNVLLIFVLNVVVGLFISFFDPVSKALMADLTPEDRRMRVFSLRYTAGNIGWAVGPLLGGYLVFMQGMSSFLATSVVYLIYAIVLQALLKKYNLREISVQDKPERIKVKDTLKATVTDKALLCLIVGGVLSMLVHGEIYVTLSQYLALQFADGVRMFAILASVNSIIVILFQFQLTKFAERWTPLTAIVIGAVLFALGEVGFAFSQGWSLFILSMILFTLGEIFILPAEYMLLDKITPAEMRGTYYGAQSFVNFGSFAGPWLGGLALSAYGGPAMFLGSGVVALSAIFFFSKGQSISQARRNKDVAAMISEAAN